MGAMCRAGEKVPFSHTSDMLMLTKLRFCTIINIYKTGINADIHGDINRGLNHGSTVNCR